MLWLLFLLIFIAWGILLWRFFFPERSRAETGLIGALAGMALATSVPFVFALMFGFPTAVGISLIVGSLGTALMLWLLGSRGLRDLFRFTRQSLRLALWPTVSFLIVSAVFLPLIPKTLFTKTNGWYATGFRAAYGDVPFHLMYITSFAWGENFPPQNPDFSGTPSNYPFLPYTVSATLATLGADLRTAFLAPAVVLGILVAALLIYVPRRLTGSTAAALLAALLFLFSGGLGAVWFFSAHGIDITSLKPLLGSGAVDEATNIPGAHISLMNVMLSSLLPQRGIFFGLPIFLAITALWWKATARVVIGSAFLAATLPWLHAHTFIATLLMAPAAFLSPLYSPASLESAPRIASRRVRYRTWAWFAVILAASALVQFALLHPAAEHSYLKTMRFASGWMLHGDNFLWFWLKNVGVALPLIFAALWSKRVPPDLKGWYAGSTLLFFFGNFLMFTPWEFDNHKLLHLWYLCSLILIAAFLVAVFRKRAIIGKSLVVALAASMALSGAIDAARLWYFSDPGFGLFSPEGQRLAEFIKRSVLADAVFLASTKHNSPLILTGRKRFLGYPGWLWAHGIDAEPRRRESAAIFRGAPEAESLIRQRGITHILIGPDERAEFDVHEAFFQACCPRVYDADGYQVFRAPPRP